MGVGPDDSGDRGQTEDVGLPEHEADETRRPAGERIEDDPAGVVVVTDDTELTDTSLPGHEDDRDRAGDTAAGEQNP